MAGADRAINMALRVLGIGEAERDFKRVGDAGSKSFAEVEKSANGAAREVSDYTARLKRAAEFGKQRMANIPELSKGTPDQVRTNRRDFMTGVVSAEKERILGGLPDATRDLGAGAGAADAFGMSLTRVTALASAAGGAIVAVGYGLKSSFDAFQEHERALDSFNATLAFTGNNSSATAAEIQAMAEKVAATSRQSEASALQGAQQLAQVTGITKEAMEQALEATARFADATGRELPDVLSSTTIPILQALANRDMKALLDATEGTDKQFRVAILTLAEAGKTAEATQVLINHLTESVAGSNGASNAADQMSKAWDGLKQSLGEAIAPAAIAGMNAIAGMLDVVRGKTDAAKASWGSYIATIAAGAGAAVASPGLAIPILGRLMPGRGGSAPRPAPAANDLNEQLSNKLGGRGTIAKWATELRMQANATATAQLKGFQTRYGGGAPKGGGRRRGGGGGARPKVDNSENEQARRDKAYADASAQVDKRILDAKRALSTDAGEIAGFARQQLRVEADKYNADIDARVTLKQLTEAQGAELKVRNAIALSLQGQKIDVDEQSRRLAVAVDNQLAANDNARDMLSAQEALADTMADRRTIGLRLLDLEKEGERIKQQEIIDQAKVGKATAEQAQRAQDRLGQLDGLYAARGQSVRDSTAGPLESYIKEMNPDRVNERVQGYVVDELQAVHNSINAAVTNVLGIEDPFLSSLVSLFIEQTLIRPLAQALQGSMGGGGGFNLGGLLGGLFGGGGGAVPGGSAAFNAAFAGFAGGSRDVPIGRPFWVGENGRELMQRNRSGGLEVLSNHESHRAVGASGGMTVINNINIPKGANPRRTQTSVNRGTQTALARATRKGVA